MADLNNDFKVDLSNIHRNRKPGISGMMRVKNDAEFIETCVASCIDALDELVIVYNDCSDESPAIIENLAKRYPEKIIVGNYLPHVISGSLSKDEYERSKSLPIDSVELLSNYYNYALSLTSYSHVMKIDADQIYYTDNLKDLCSRIRCAKISALSLSDWISFAKMLLRKVRHKPLYPNGLSISAFMGYRRVLEYLCNKGIFSLTLSGINLFIYNQEHYVTQGFKTGDLNILGPFNGTADHPIFKVRKSTRFVPYDCQEYNSLISAQFSFIEKLKGIPKTLPWGFMWWHLNSIRRKIMARQISNFMNHRDAFVDIQEFKKISSNDILSMSKSEFIGEMNGRNYALLWKYTRHELPINSLKDLKIKL